MKAKSDWEMPEGKLIKVEDNLPSPQQLARIRHANRDHKIKDKKFSGCALCKPWKHGWTRERDQGKRNPSVQGIKREL